MKKITSVLLSLILMASLLAGCSETAVVHKVADVVSEYHYTWESDSESKTAPASDEEISKMPLRVHFLDVGQADSTFLELPDGKTLLIDAGNPENADDIINFVSALGYGRLDYVVATHPHADHIGGMAAVLEYFDVDKIFMPKKENTTKAFENMLEVISDKEIPLYSAKKGAVICENEEYKINILSPEQEEYDNLNNYSAVVKLTYGKTEYLFMGDAERKIETPLKKLDIEADVLKLGHHGSSTSSGQEFLSMVSPKYSVISCGLDNSYGHPHDEVINRLDRLGMVYFRTDLEGTVTIAADNNENFVVKKEKQA